MVVQWLTPGFHCRGHRFNPCWGTKILQPVWCGKKKKKGQFLDPDHGLKIPFIPETNGFLERS